nr:TAT-variant-translocated molybdopterin oxidoreductase [Pyrinomonadaceae bacterium]
MHIKDTFPELYQLRRQKPLQLEAVREKLSKTQGKEFWRSLEELAESEEFDEFLHREFPQHASEWDEGTDRRSFLKLMGASLALAGLSGCVYQPPETLVPYVRDQENIIPGQPLFFATAMPATGGAMGLLVRSNMGRPTKIEGNPEHPASLGATDHFAQAALLTLYDPDRSPTILYRGEIRSYIAFLGDLNRALEEQGGKGGAGLRFLSEVTTSPTFAAQMQEIGRRFPNARWHQYEPAGANSAAAGARLAFGQFVNTIYDFSRADRVLSLDADFLSCGATNLRYAREFANRRRLTDGNAEMNRLYAIETTPTNTGVCADHRLAVRPSEMEVLARALAARLGAAGAASALTNGAHVQWLEAVARDLQSARGRSIVIAGDEQAPLIHALAQSMNGALGNVGQTVRYTEPVEVAPVDHIASLRELIVAIQAGQVEALVIIGGNPVYTTPADLKLDQALLDKVKLRVHLSMYHDETSELCHWHIPQAHFLESWSDARAFDGTASIIQPLIRPLYNGKGVHEFLAAFTERPDQSGYDIVRGFWQSRIAGGGIGNIPVPIAATGQTPGGTATGQGTQQPATNQNRQDGTNQGPATQGQQARTNGTQGTTAATPAPATATTAAAPAQTSAPPSADFEKLWRKAVHDGVIPGTEAQTISVSARGDLPGVPPPVASGGNALEIVFRPDPTIYDGRFANNGWLQELPKPLTKLTWDGVAFISPATARQFGLGNANNITSKGQETLADILRLDFRGRQVAFPVWIMPGQPDGVVTIPLGYGRWRAGRVGTITEGKPDNLSGFQNAYMIRTSDALWSGVGLNIANTGETYPLASTQLHFNIEDEREIIRAGTLEEYKHDPRLAPHRDEDKQPPAPAGENRHPAEHESLYPEFVYNGYKWGMAIDLSTCVGCNACIVACQAENNIPVVGKDQISRA